jgi:hypothetical protein
MIAKHFKNLGQRLSLDHHSQGMLVAAAIFFIIIRAWWSLPGLVLYGIMHFQYGGTGTFQNPPRNDDRPATMADVAYVVMGLLGLAIMLAGIGIRIAKIFA